MTTKPHNNLEITGLVLELPPVKEPNRAIERKHSIKLDSSVRKISCSPTQPSKTVNSNRSLSQLAYSKNKPIPGPSNEIKEQETKTYEVNNFFKKKTLFYF
jgi:hypothetical protein